MIGHVGCSLLWTIGNDAAVTVGVQISLQVPAFSSLGCVPRSGIAGSWGNSACSVGRNQQSVRRRAAVLGALEEGGAREPAGAMEAGKRASQEPTQPFNKPAVLPSTSSPPSLPFIHLLGTGRAICSEEALNGASVHSGSGPGFCCHLLSVCDLGHIMLLLSSLPEQCQAVHRCLQGLFCPSS